ncbi:MAG: hypothetical protein AB7Q00_13920 [Phycisphaerales bacterium]
MRFSDYFGTTCSQAELDFVDITLGRDIKVFLDPYALANTRTDWCEDAHAIAWGFFDLVLRRLKDGKREEAKRLLGHLHEDNRTRLGYSDDKPQGTGFGESLTVPFMNAWQDSDAFKSGYIGDLETAALFVDGIGLDIVSDMTTNMIHEPLAKYTQEQCRLLGIPMEKSENLVVWRNGVGWIPERFDLPTDGVFPVLLVPRSIIRKDLSLEPDPYLTDFLDEYYEKSDPHATSSLEKLIQQVPMKHKGKSVHRRDLREKLWKKGSKKSVMAKVMEGAPKTLDGYKARARLKRPVLTPHQIENIHPEHRAIDLTVLRSLIRRVWEVTDDVGKLLRVIARALTASFHPILQHPRLLGVEIDGVAGVVFSNAASDGLLWQWRHDGNKDDPNLVVLTTASSITDELLARFDFQAMRQSTKSGAVVLVGTEIDKAVRERRDRLRKSRVMLLRISDLARIIEVDAGPDVAMETLKSIVAQND